LFLNRVKPHALCYWATCQLRIALSRSPRTSLLPTMPRGRPVPPVSQPRPDAGHLSHFLPPHPPLSPAKLHVSHDSPDPPLLRSHRPPLEGYRRHRRPFFCHLHANPPSHHSDAPTSSPLLMLTTGDSSEHRDRFPLGKFDHRATISGEDRRPHASLHVSPVRLTTHLPLPLTGLQVDAGVFLAHESRPPPSERRRAGCSPPPHRRQTFPGASTAW
jgi:hypothetical protein